MDTFLIAHPDKPEAGQVVCDAAAWPQWSANGWVRCDSVADAKPEPIDDK